MKINKAVILAGGMGTRFLPVTKAFPKEMLPILNKPALQYIAEEAAQSGISEIAIVINDEKEAVKRYFSAAPVLEARLRAANKRDLLCLLAETTGLNVEFVVQSEPKGSGHALQCARGFIGGAPFALLNGDDVVYGGADLFNNAADNAGIPATKQLCGAYGRFGKSVIGVQRVAAADVDKYGIVHETGGDGRVRFIDAVVEKPRKEDACGNLAALGRYVLTTEIFDALDEIKPAANGELQLTDAINMLCGRGGVIAYEFSGRRYDLGSRRGYVEANIEYALRDPEIGKATADFIKGLGIK
jgi:UTP--glucose-1-phosphate uridylyltransferase